MDSGENVYGYFSAGVLHKFGLLRHLPVRFHLGGCFSEIITCHYCLFCTYYLNVVHVLYVMRNSPNFDNFDIFCCTTILTSNLFHTTEIEKLEYNL